MGKQKKKAKKKCCGKFRKKGKHCKRCPIILNAKKKKKGTKKKKKTDKKKKKKDRKK